jgi:hypothetical protein
MVVTRIVVAVISAALTDYEDAVPTPAIVALPRSCGVPQAALSFTSTTTQLRDLSCEHNCRAGLPADRRKQVERRNSA